MADLPTKHSGFADVDGARLYYEVAGSGPVVALLHFGLGDSRCWDDQFLVFAEQYTVVRYDYRGFGRSSMPPGEYSQRGDLDAVLTTLGLGSVAVVGVSMGGGLALDYALAFPERVRAVVAVGASPSGFVPAEDLLADLERLFAPVDEAAQRGDIERANDLEVHIWVDGPRRTADHVPFAARARVREMNLLCWRRQEELKQGTPLALDPPAIGRLSAIPVPTLAVVGDEDLPHLLVAAELIAHGIPGARKAMMHDTAHAPNMEKPEEFNRLVLDFLGEHLG